MTDRRERMMRKMFAVCGLLALLLCLSVNNIEAAKDDKGKDAESQGTSTAWTKISGGSTPESLPFKKRRHTLKVAFKEGHEPDIRIKITKIKYHKKVLGPGETNPVEVAVSATGPGTASDVTLPTDIDWSKDVEVETTTYHKDGPIQPPVDTVEYDVSWYDAEGDILAAVEVGGDAVVAVDEEEPVTLFDIAEEKLGLDSTDFETPDLMVWCHDSINSGELRFCPVGQFRFTSLPDTAHIHIFDVDGNDLSATTVAVDYMQLTARGDLSFILNVTGTTSPLGIIVRDVEVTKRRRELKARLHRRRQCYSPPAIRSLPDRQRRYPAEQLADNVLDSGIRLGLRDGGGRGQRRPHRYRRYDRCSKRRRQLRLHRVYRDRGRVGRCNQERQAGLARCFRRCLRSRRER